MGSVNKIPDFSLPKFRPNRMSMLNPIQTRAERSGLDSPDNLRSQNGPRGPFIRGCTTVCCNLREGPCRISTLASGDAPPRALYEVKIMDVLFETGLSIGHMAIGHYS